MALRSKQGSVHIGTSGWHYKHWRGPVDLSIQKTCHLPKCSAGMPIDSTQLELMLTHSPRHGAFTMSFVMGPWMNRNWRQRSIFSRFTAASVLQYPLSDAM